MRDFRFCQRAASEKIMAREVWEVCIGGDIGFKNNLRYRNFSFSLMSKLYRMIFICNSFRSTVKYLGGEFVILSKLRYRIERLFSVSHALHGLQTSRRPAKHNFVYMSSFIVFTQNILRQTTTCLLRFYTESNYFQNIKFVVGYRIYLLQRKVRLPLCGERTN